MTPPKREPNSRCGRNNGTRKAPRVYQQTFALEDIDHTRTKAKSPQIDVETSKL